MAISISYRSHHLHPHFSHFLPSFLSFLSSLPLFSFNLRQAADVATPCGSIAAIQDRMLEWGFRLALYYYYYYCYCYCYCYCCCYCYYYYYYCYY